MMQFIYGDQNGHIEPSLLELHGTVTVVPRAGDTVSIEGKMYTVEGVLWHPKEGAVTVALEDWT